MPHTYTSYLRLDELLDLQTPASGGEDHDEMLFIVIHQVYELWFRQVLYEIDLLRRAFEENDRPLALATLKRVSQSGITQPNNAVPSIPKVRKYSRVTWS